jgi:UDP-galactopyranose mutase
MLAHPNIGIHLNSDAFVRIRLHSDSGKILLDGTPFDGPVCYTGALDELFDYALGALPYRSLDLQFEDHALDCYQNTPVVNYPNDELYTRITEFKHITLQDVPNRTTILKEYPLPYQPGGKLLPFYPIESNESKKKYQDYLNLSRKYRDLYLCGRLAEYKYYNMDAVIARALSIAGDIISKFSEE